LSTQPAGTNPEQLIREVTQSAENHIRGWYQSEDAKFVMNATDKGKQAFTWEGFYRDGTVIRQYDEIAFYRALTDSEYIPDQGRLVSTAALDKEKTVKFVLHPTALLRKRCPWFPHPYTVVIRPEVGERLLAFWEVDYRPRDGWKVYRTAVGVQLTDQVFKKEISRTVLVFSPSGSITLAGSTNVSFEGE
jgi:hypothetical protein